MDIFLLFRLTKIPKVKVNNLFMNTPNFFIVGAAKAGTTSLYNYLLDHPEVYLSPIKEPNYFNTELKFKNCRLDVQESIILEKDYFKEKNLERKHSACFDDIQEYLELYRGATSEKIIGEASTSYLYSSQAAKEIYAYNKNAKIVIILREPVSRTISHYNMDIRSGNTSGNMLQDLKSDFNADKKGYFISNMYIDLSLYYNQVKNYLSVFPKEQIIVLRFEDLVAKREEVLKNLCNFLQIDFSKLPISTRKIYNKTVIPKNKIIHKLLVLKKFFPKPLHKYFLFLKSILFKPYKKENIPKETVDYIKSKVKNDFKLTNQLLNRHFSEGV